MANRIQFIGHGWSEGKTFGIIFISNFGTGVERFQHQKSYIQVSVAGFLLNILISCV